MRKVLLAVLLVLASLPAAADEITAVTINVWSGIDYEGTLKMGEYESRDVREQRYQLLLAELKEINPDVVALNEANPLPRYARRLARDLDMDFVYSVGMGGLRVGPVGIPTNFREGDAILARKGLGLSRLGKERLSGKGIITNFVTLHASESNQVIGAAIVVNGKTVYLFNTHVHASPPYDQAFLDRLDGLFREGKLTEEGLARAKASIADGQKWRAGEIEKLLDFIAQKTPAGAPVILMGDFNAEAYTPEMQPVFDRGFIDTFGTKNPDDPGHTWNPAANLNSVYYEKPRGEQTPETIAGGLDDLVSKRIDFIFAAGPFRVGDVVESRVVFDRAVNGRHPSDHFGLMSVIQIP